MHGPPEYADQRSPAIVMGPAENVKGMYRLLDFGGSWSNGYGRVNFWYLTFHFRANLVNYRLIYS